MIINCKDYYNGFIKLIKFKIFRDNRGHFIQNYNTSEYLDVNIKNKFIQDNFSFTKKTNTIRGLHYQNNPFKQSKLLTIMSGKILDVVVDLRKNSKTYGSSMNFILSHKSYNQIYISKGFAHGFQTLTNNVNVYYKVDSKYSQNHEKTILWNDKKLDIKWKKIKSDIIVSKKDRDAEKFIPGVNIL